MKRFIAILMICLIGSVAFAQDLVALQEGVVAFADDLAIVMAASSSIGNQWSDGFIGQFLHLGAGLSLGAIGLQSAVLAELIATTGLTIPGELQTYVDQYGLPFPAAALSAKLGGFLLPFDMGVKAMIMPEEVAGILSEQGIAMNYYLLGANVRYAVIQEAGIIPEIVLGLAYNRLAGNIGMTMASGSMDYSFDIPSPHPDAGTHTISVTNPTMAFNFTTDNYELSAQISKKILFLRPYLGGSASIGRSAVTGGLDADMLYDDNPITAEQYAEIVAAMEAGGLEAPIINAEGFAFESIVDSSFADPQLRVYGGLSVELLIIVLDASVMWLPVSNNFGFTVMARVQF
ncbi:MAG: hypothetical protein A2087_11875 [Spirochaetes bacterium GWD1_61_31]|nr:MAG: hypothetical protein A2Y37_04750 [Spirochaetes bacterium GWB1_60_80]OHD34795.1 MAG: hypothetical protein A2004_08750 [Spirochaetes bacterium GWC1_61_12]OHD41733.1 MAG: hypothetical protein A2087_11875 [Spirochaetes bacterium GWD1_61_31]OHD44601.1 MAG: hypothetical protein A2Y35_11940 [Spirochaetes bacterium GWE1_60_18]OHD57926.1 MAG: hypothetical protein A2Y32_03935 [Spirochaetes bacterium GWF1_60_12]HAP43863.1 hypothetical protein [Spirochaetaceae bacterium]